ncbi:MAG: CHAT domain-containing protein [Microcoleus sp. PH2017_01_SCD_O_A]|uniref:CHAT domain-containing protein n=1 Tax=unclassified Microcoleus TaxID=2642155 RepID=UPI001DAFB2B8|nr:MULTISPECIES: CHAT domain-containing protein [unclassified Microcoleus]MCC3427425.1 CHAT domain-containing protein [Microcoleus sp. PH2017_01_SCD_O_A]MCC3457108.1 CHAT domain-containing protein [Microcoleus sp. PH2017_08_TRC_O_A]TAG62686.1 MAG: CHAT domain-containing protein [Oscillatoriales cyanobacterium]
MDETRDRAYQQLIQTLLTCPSGDEPQILQANLELLDRGFLQACESVAENLTQQGQENAASFLRNLASQLGQFLDGKDEGDGDDSEGENSQEYVKFILELLQAAAASGSDIKVIHSILGQRQHLLNARFGEILQEVVKKLIVISKNTKEISLIIGIFENLSVRIFQFPRANRTNNIEIAITGYQIVLSYREPGSKDWARTQVNLANAYLYRINGSRADNLEQAICFFNTALTVFTLQNFAEEWAMTQVNLATAYKNRINGDRVKNLELAIDFFNAALTVYTLKDFAEEWALTQNNLANTYSDRIKGSRAQNLELAINFYNEALKVRTLKDFPKDWAMTQNNLANAYGDRLNGDQAENLEWAISFYNAALTVRTLKDFPEEWAETQNNLAGTYIERIKGDQAQNLEQAISFFDAALTVYTLEDFREKWAMTQNNLATAYLDRIKGSRADNVERAIASYTAALTIRTRDAFPEDWAMTQNNLAIAYRNRIRGEKAENIELAIASCTAALTIYTRNAFPEKWAMTQNNLAIAYSDRIRGEKAENIEQATKCYGNALTIRTREAFPQGYTETLSNLGTLYRSNQQWQLAYDTYALAIETVELLRGEIQSGDESKQKSAEKWNRLYLGMVEVCIQLKRYTEAVEYADRSKGQNLIELLSRRIAEENERLKQAEEKNYDIINQLRQDLAAKYPYTPLNFGEIQQLADKKTAIVEWYILSNSFCAFIITKHNPQPQVLRFSESDVDKLIDWTREYLGDYYPADIDRHLPEKEQIEQFKQLRDEKWEIPLSDKLKKLAQILHIDQIVNAIPKTCDKLILIPHRHLHLFPLHALPLTNNTAKCLIDAFPGGVSYAPSCQLLHQVQKYKRSKFDKLFAIQNPTDNLLAADIEVETIKNIFLNSEILAKGNAKKGELSESKLEIAERVADSHHLFFSCHGSFNPNDPLQSGLELADGTLTLEEIIRYFNLSECSLVTLSACETGQVQPDDTDEYISFTSGFLLAGSPSLYVTLWSVNAFSTAILMIKTYENLSQQPGKFALSLNQAQIWMRDTDIQGFLDWIEQCHLLNKECRGILQRNMDIELENLGTNDKIYQNPYHWAGFCAAGKGEQKYE